MRPPSLPVLNCPFLIFSASSTPLITTAAVPKPFKPQHRSQPVLHSPVVLFDQVVQILTTSHQHALRQLAARLQIGYRTVGGGIGVEGDLRRSPLLAHGFAEKCFGRCDIALTAQV